MKIQESAQDYLESILILSRDKEYVRATDVCNYFGYARATVSVFLKQLKENEFIDIDEHNHITLTSKGREIAEQMYDRHQSLTNFFCHIGVPEDVAAEDACRIEHYISDTTYQALKEYAKTLDK